jgi:hypothetical protein
VVYIPDSLEPNIKTPKDLKQLCMSWPSPEHQDQGPWLYSDTQIKRIKKEWSFRRIKHIPEPRHASDSFDLGDIKVKGIPTAREAEVLSAKYSQLAEEQYKILLARDDAVALREAISRFQICGPWRYFVTKGLISC